MKVKFTKLAALLLAGVALLAAGCTDYEVDIQKVDKKVDELAVKTAADLDAQVNALKAMIATVEQNIAKVEKDYKDADAALKTELEGKLNDLKKQLEDQVKDLQALIDKKVDQTVFDAYKAETAETLRLLNEAVNEIKANYATKKELEDAVAEITAKLDDYVLKTTFEEFVSIAATKAELEALEKKLEKELADAKEEMVQKINDAIAGVEEKIEALDERVTVLETAVADVIDELAFAEGDLQGYIDDADAATLEAAMDYVDEYIDALLDYIDELMFDVWGAVTILQQRMQSIVYVPDYDDLKITVNMAYVSQEVADDDLKPQAEGVNTEKEVVVIDQPFKVQYKILPAQYAAWVAASYDELLEYDVKPVNTRAEEEEADKAPALQIIAADYDDDVDETGIITFTVMPINIASAQFAANGLKPKYNIGLYAGGSVGGYEADPDSYYGYTFAGVFGMDERDMWEEYGYDVLTFGVWNIEDLEAYQARTAFAASMRMKYQESVGTGVYHYYYGEIADDYFPEYNEIASTYNVLYPDVTEIEILPDPYKPELDENGDPKVDEEGNTVLVKAVPEYQYLPYSSLRENPVGEAESQDPKGYRIILDQAVPGIEIDGNVYTVEDAAKKGYVLPAITTVFDEFTYEQGKAAELDEENFVETAKVYAEIEMNPAKTAAERKLAVGNIITGWYHFETTLGKTPFYGQVEITKPLGEVKLTAEIKWEYSQDADTDHEVYYNEADPLYTHVEVPVAINAEDAKALEDNLAVTIADFAGLEPTKLTITYVDAETGETVEATDVKIENVKIEDGELFADFVDFEWDQTYTVVAEYELEAALITVTATVTTVDRNRDLIVVNVPEYAFELNGEDYDAESDTYTSEAQEIQKDLFDAFVKQLIINQLDPKDFEDEDAFIGLETEGKEGHLEVVPEDKLEEGEVNSEYVEVADDNVTLVATSPELKAILEAGEDQTIFVTSYTGQKIEIIWPVTVDLPGYDFLHLNYYTFNSQKETANFITKLDFADNDGSVIWWSQVFPSYFTTVKSENETEGEAQKSRVSNRYALADYDVAYINLAELAFNVVDEKDEIMDEEAIEEANLVVKFVYTDEELGEKELPKVDQIDDEFLLYESLWVNNTVFYYRTNEMKWIPARGTLGILSGETVFELPTRFDVPKASVKYPSENLDYSTYAMVRWTPFKAPKADGITIVLDENLIYQVPLFKGMELKDNRPNGTSFYVIKDGEWVIGDAAENATASSTSNGYIEGIAANEAYHITTDFVYDTTGVPAELKKLLSVEEIDGVPYVIYDYTSEVQFHGVVTIPVVVVLENPWQEAIKFVYDITIKGIGD
ncbi:MAG: apolipoprotein A1/A4/E family protein [Bacteroidales bacterium]|nr:apolipoprotein A1/A4/E family protein [Bacteroidales bacterium]